MMMSNVWAIATFAGQVMFSTGPLEVSVDECINMYRGQAQAIATEISTQMNLPPEALDLMGLVNYTCIESDTDPMKDFALPVMGLGDLGIEGLGD
jgi:hypothetical protein